MKLNVDGTDFTLSEQVQESLLAIGWNLLQQKYEGIGSTSQLGIKLLVRNKVLQPLEQKLTEQYGKEVGRLARPPRGGDPVLHAATLLLPQLKEVLNRTTLNISIEDSSDTISAVSVSIASTRESGGPLDTDGSDGERENDGAEVS